MVMWPSWPHLWATPRVAEAYGGPIDAGGQVVDVYLDAPMIHQSSRVRYTSGQ